MRNFALSLYAFHLCQTLTDAPDDVVADASLLWENLVKIAGSSLPFPGLNDLKSNLICYNNNQYEPQREQGRQSDRLTHTNDLDLGSISTASGFEIQGNLQAFRLNDTYAADLTLSPEPSDTEISCYAAKFNKQRYLYF